MNLVRLAITRPVAVLSIVLMVVLMGWVALTAIPIQLTPDVRKPFITITTLWRGAAPAEMEKDIVNRQEDALKGLEGLEEMTSRSQRGRGQIGLTFNINQNMDRALLLVSNRFNTIRNMPPDATEPRIRTRDSDDSPIAYFTVTALPSNKRNIFTYGDLIEDVIQDRLERVPGVALVNVWGGNKRELRIVVDPQRMARYGITVSEMSDVLSRANISMSAGELDEGKRTYVVRTEGELTTVERAKTVLLRSRVDPATGRIARVTLDDVATIELGFKKGRVRIQANGKRAIIVNAVRETGTNVIQVMEGIKRVVKELNDGPLPFAGLKLTQVYDETVYIKSAIGLVNQNIYIGGTFAVLILLLFLRSFRATLVVSLAIPVSVVGSFVAMAALGRSINVMSLAGFAFAIGMVVDAAIVVLENIYRLRQGGASRIEAALKGASQVWGAVMVSAITTVMVFVPILVMDLEIGQLFRDIAVAISVAVLLSLIVAITVIPTLSNKLLGGGVGQSKARMRIPVIDDFADFFVRGVVGFTRLITVHKILAIAVVVAVGGMAALATWAGLPKLEYLPEGNRNLVIGRILPPPGYNLATTTEITEQMESKVRHLWASETGPDSKPGDPPKMSRFWTIVFSSFTLIAGSSVDPMRAGELVPVLREVAGQEPGSFAFVTQSSLFGRHIGGSRAIDLDISGPDLNDVMAVARRGMQLTNQAFPRSEGNQVRPRPGLDLGAPEIRVIPNFVRLTDTGVSARELALTIDAYNDGVRVAEVTVDGRRIDLTVKGPESKIVQTQGIGNIPVVTKSGLILPVSELANIEVTEGPTQIRHLERDRTVTLQIRPTKSIPLEVALDTVRTEITDKLKAEGLPPGVKLGLSGTANKLRQSWEAMVFNLILALAIVYLVMAVLFESFVYPLIIMFSVPLATAGGVGGLVILNLFVFNPLDMLTLLGFVILIGIVVNNAILLVHQTQFLIRSEGFDISEAIVEATRNRIRPIFMSTLTSIGGMLPLILFPGPGSELYRGLGSVVVGGLALSALLTLLIIPPLLTFVAGFAERNRVIEPAAVPAEAAAE